MIKQSIILVSFLFLNFALTAQIQGLKEWYPIGNCADINFRTSYSPYESPILFEANPIVRYSFYNNMRYIIEDSKLKHCSSFYIVFKPQIRMYKESSVPVKMPSYRLEFGFQKLFKLHHTQNANNYLTIGIESGHYSNGQSGGAFDSLHFDNSFESNLIINSINNSSNLSKLLNRRDGNFSTNLSEILLNYRSYRAKNLDSKNSVKHMHSVLGGLSYYHKYFLFMIPFGGPTLKNEYNIYGRFYYSLAYEYSYIFPSKYCENCPSKKLSFSENIEIIAGANKNINPFRSESKISFFFGSISKYKYRYNPPSGDFGIYVSFMHGHDNYNYRVVDNINQFAVGFCWDIAPAPFIFKSRSNQQIDDSETDIEN